MTTLKNKIDFAAIITVNKANPNGDPLNGNRPREDYEGRGEISDVCIKRKIRNRLIDMGEEVFVQSDEKNVDGYKSLSERAQAYEPLKTAGKAKDKDAYEKAACEKWIDVRTFGQVFAFKADNVSVGVRGPVSVHSAVSIDPIDIYSMQITKSVNSEPAEKKSSDTMGMKHRVDFGVYLLKGSINTQLAEKTGFSDEDAEKVKEALRTLFVNDVSSARPDGSMEVKTLYWWEHNCAIGQYSSAKVHGSIHVEKRDGIDQPVSFDDYKVVVDELPGLKVEEIEGM